ncbi:hypothetical protein [Streptomyces djakartensis]
MPLDAERLPQVTQPYVVIGGAHEWRLEPSAHTCHHRDPPDTPF